MENPMKTTADLVAWLRGRRELLRLIKEDLELFAKTRIDPSDIEGKSAEYVESILGKLLAPAPARRIAEALCKEINGADVGECLQEETLELAYTLNRHGPFWAHWSAFS
jgi:hypothetical protein